MFLTKGRSTDGFLLEFYTEGNTVYYPKTETPGNFLRRVKRNVYKNSFPLPFILYLFVEVYFPFELFYWVVEEVI